MLYNRTGWKMSITNINPFYAAIHNNVTIPPSYQCLEMLGSVLEGLGACLSMNMLRKTSCTVQTCSFAACFY